MNKRLLAVLMIFSIFLTSCNFHESAIKNVSKESKTGISNNEVVWTLEESAEIPQENVDKLNELLYQKGYDVSVKFKYIENNPLDNSPKPYHQALEKSIKNKETDIVFCGWEYDSYPNEMLEFLNKGYFYSLNEWLDSDEGKLVYDLYDDEIWKAASIDGTVYALPNEKICYQPRTVVGFNKKYISDKIISSWDGSWNDILRILDRVNIHENVMPISGYPCISGFQDATDKMAYGVRDNLFYNLQSGKVSQPFDTDGFYQYMLFLNSCYEKKYLTNVGMDYENYTEDELKLIDNDQYVIDINAQASTADENIVYKEGSFGVSNDLGLMTAVCANSNKLQYALLLMKALRTDDELANTLVWGSAQDDDVLEDDGFVSENITLAGGWDLGLSDGVYQERGAVSKDMRAYKSKSMASDMRVTSNIAGFYPDYSKLKKNLEQYNDVLDKYKNCWKESNFETAYNTASENVKRASKKLVTRINQQVKKWKEEN